MAASAPSIATVACSLTLATEVSRGKGGSRGALPSHSSDVVSFCPASCCPYTANISLKCTPLDTVVHQVEMVATRYTLRVVCYTAMLLFPGPTGVMAWQHRGLCYQDCATWLLLGQVGLMVDPSTATEAGHDSWPCLLQSVPGTKLLSGLLATRAGSGNVPGAVS
jgi:hypothetical protein